MRKNAVIIKPNETLSYYSQCLGKVSYSKIDARLKAKEVAKSGRARQMGVYECIYCRGWHLTHTKGTRK